MLRKASEAARGKPFLPVAERVLSDGEKCLAYFAGTRAPLCDMRKGKISHHRARRADLVAVIKVIHLRVIEIDYLLHPTQTQSLGEEVAVLLGIGGH